MKLGKTKTIIAILLVLFVFIINYFNKYTDEDNHQETILSDRGEMMVIHDEPSKNEEPSESEETREQLINEQLLVDSDNLLWSVLLGKDVFYYVTNEGETSWSIDDVTGIYGEKKENCVVYFTMVDLDGDDKKEFIFDVIPPAGDAGGKVILHQIEGKVYAYRTGFRTLWELKTDGTYTYGSKALDGDGCAVITEFSKEDYTENVFMSESWREENFMINQESVSEAVYDNALRRQKGKINAKWYELNQEGIYEAFLKEMPLKNNAPEKYSD